ncbi:MAG TPA: carbonic anhydrase [Candidatus Binatia bacterium]|jgi:carbonic anhydrase|nr:carbonic anhydrase [Candidatus Binatia bacterium]
MSAIDEALHRNDAYASTFDLGGLPHQPAQRLAVVACMDSRIDVHRVLGLREGDAHVIRNAGGVVTDDVIRSLLISQRLLGTEEVLLLHHTRCGMQSFRDDDLKADVERDTGVRPSFALEAFADLEGDVRQSIARLRSSPFVADQRVRGFVYDVDTGRLAEVV